MDGNGRWASSRGHNRFYGHIRGARVARSVIEECSKLGINTLTLFAFSTENWFRPESEVSFLMNLLVRQLRRERDKLNENNIRFQVIGDLDRLPRAVAQEVLKTIELTEKNSGMSLVFALSYGGRQEITAMVREAARKVQDGELEINEIDDATVAGLLPSSFLPDPDLIIRTSGESRISNFFLWQAAYSEIYFENKPWPDFTLADLHKILAHYSKCERRFGRTSDQIKDHGRQL